MGDYGEKAYNNGEHYDLIFCSIGNKQLESRMIVVAMLICEMRRHWPHDFWLHRH